MSILISGSTGLLGTALLESWRAQGQLASRLVRPATPAGMRDASQQSGHTAQRNVLWDPVAGVLDSGAENASAVVHLAGASIGDQRWTPGRKRVLQESRVSATRHLVGALGKLRHPPQVFVAASAVGFYGDRGDEVLTEESAAGSGFLAELGRDWEAESARAAEFGARVVILRFGIVLAKRGGALPRMALPFRLGLGGRIGPGRQWMSWISLQDAVRVVDYAITTNLLSGSANAVTPHPVRNSEFVAELARALHRPALFPAPAFALRLLLGEMADSLLLSSQRVMPKKLEQLGYKFLYPELESALEAALGSRRQLNPSV